MTFIGETDEKKKQKTTYLSFRRRGKTVFFQIPVQKGGGASFYNGPLWQGPGLQSYW